MIYDYNSTEEVQVLEEKLKSYQFPYCSKGGDHTAHQLNKFCIDTKCRKDQILEPHCIICEEYRTHNTPTHVTKPLKLAIRDLITQVCETEEDKKVEDEIEINLLKIAQDYKALADKLYKLSDDAYASLDIYRLTMSKESPKKREVRQILYELLSNEQETNLRTCLKKLVPLTMIDRGTLIVTDEVNMSIKRAVESNSDKYIQIMRDSLRRLSQLTESLLEISILEGYEEMNGNLKAEDMDGYETFNSTTQNGNGAQQQSNGASSPDKNQTQKRERRKKNLEEKRVFLEKEIEQHIVKCNNKNCEEVKPNKGIGSWRITDCYYGRKLNEEWLKVLNHLQYEAH
ncbi:hypothetical protein TTHERM_00125210 (macronuclear) [Tetrahymena thermophila SB210]|uniref:Uncharacterized protein n=1 Tax=Tetrahymena thermophila (strain SB210) TaxID=312017 RepID=I7MJ48_TETTS|nr:hypothetical protein TTHERM_00125210 [Tetrahymena thermophila SB210]EAR95955.2 hypothetical protein TTHERM_00125210 [Tetrahymena thermophila SB210]|eukprot:XP_001016200.2 hypothetical protein TTHERM_00125210 [Tetrahymena thermophila SB210]